MTAPDLAAAIAQAQQSVARHESQNAGDPFHFDLTEHRYVALRDLLAALSTPPADDVREALAAARNVERYLDMLALYVDEHAEPIDDGYDGDGVIQSLEVPDIRTLIAFVRQVRPRGTVTDSGAWVCAKCGGSALDHSLTTSTCVWEPQWRGTVTDAAVEAGAWALLDRGMDLADRSPSQEVYEEAKADARAVLEAAREVHP